MRWTRPGFRTLALAALASRVFMPGALPQDQTASPTPRASSSPEASPADGAQNPAEKQKNAQSEFLVVIDPSHGGDDRGVVFAPRLFEKDLALALARDLRRELEDRGIPARLLREGDSNLSLDRRAEIANEQRGGIYVALHAGLPGRGVRVYSPMMSALPTAEKTRFQPWETAQAGSAERSKALAKAVSRELQKKSMDVSNLRAPLRPLNNVMAPAIAVEMTPERGEARSLENTRRQNALAAAIASGIAQVRGQMGGRP